MMRHKTLEHRFVHLVPDALEPGILYLALEFGIVTHSCACGCGEEVVTPLTPTGWSLAYDGEAISLWPSVGSWTLACRSHYIIRRGRILVAEPWSDDQVENARRREREANDRFYGVLPAETPRAAQLPMLSVAPSAVVAPKRRQGFWAWLTRWRRR